ncbi:flagellar hook capping FlgD N-terminal domain-containing protein [Rhodovulum sulfidophilum]|uniref:flagellar hook capping FlgD N-terminal domain-containing protein n=1 Tax=Rhodovulum sulfidophilum TaxID=35806 RepID=UPI0019203E0D|nr:flagellar hook capping FlgD N-terminal domain-containing protein [Rhodovulum sulfidophilum]MBL3560549.1 hypothetical protein [Rhodovulum sulfidophilum]
MTDSVTAVTAATNASSSSSSGNSKTLISNDFETFLRMLTTQLENQDPLNPMESSEYALQIATFSGVEQQVLTNDLLTNLTENLGGGGLSQYGSWVGMEAAAPVAVKYDGSTQLTILPEIEADASSAKLVVRNSEGSIVESREIDLPAETVTWPGESEAKADTYSFIVESYAADGSQMSETLGKVYAPIAEVRTEAGKVSVVFESGSIVNSNDVSALRDPV